MEESSTYQFVLRRGEIRLAQRMLMRQGEIKFGQPADAATQSQIESITELERLESLMERFVLVSSWSDLLAEV